jgi:hypothetical protein
MIPGKLLALKEFMPQEHIDEARECVDGWLQELDLREARAFLEGFKTCAGAYRELGCDIDAFFPIFLALEEEIEKREVAA